MPKPLLSLLRFMLRPVLRFLARVLYRLEIVSAHPDFSAPRLMIIANHESFLDGLLLLLYLPVEPVFVVNTRIARIPFFRFLLTMVDHLTIDPVNPMSTRQIIHLVESGRPVMIFPEGRITLTGSMMKIYEGTAFVAARTGASVIPVRFDGPVLTPFSRMGRNSPRKWFPKIRMTVLPATTIPMPEAPTAKLRRHRAAEAMRRIMQEMLFVTRPPRTLIDGLLEASNIFGRRRKILEDIRQVEYSYGDLIKMTLMLGRLGSRLGVPGERIGLLLPGLAPTIGMVIGLGAFRRVPALLNFTAGTEGMQNACIAADIRTVVTSHAFLEQGKLLDKVAALKNVRIVYLEDMREQVSLLDRLWWIGYARWLPRAAVHSSDGSPEDTAVVLFTSGTEGKPKGVALSHRAIMANIEQVRAIVDIRADDKFLNALPLFHSFGLTGGALLPLMTGANLFLYPTPLHYRVIPELSYDRRCTVLFGTGTFLGHYGRYAHPYDFYRLRYVVAGAEKLSPQIRDLWFEKFGIRVLEGYGTTETAPVLSVNTPMAYRTGSVGELLPGIRHRIVPVPGIDHGGILHVSGPNVMNGYYRFEHPGVIEPPSSELGPGWYDTGDVADIDQDGFMHILGRVKRFAKVAGEMISLEATEAIAAAASPGKMHAVTTVHDPQRGESLVLYTTDHALTRDRLHEAAKELGQTELALPRRIVVAEKLPLLGSGKADYVTLKRMAEELQG